MFANMLTDKTRWQVIWDCASGQSRNSNNYDDGYNDNKLSVMMKMMEIIFIADDMMITVVMVIKVMMMMMIMILMMGVRKHSSQMKNSILCAKNALACFV